MMPPSATVCGPICEKLGLAIESYSTCGREIFFGCATVGGVDLNANERAHACQNLSIGLEQLIEHIEWFTDEQCFLQVNGVAVGIDLWLHGDFLATAVGSDLHIRNLADNVCHQMYSSVTTTS